MRPGLIYDEGSASGTVPMVTTELPRLWTCIRNYLQNLTTFGEVITGSKADHEISKFIADEFKELGLEVRLIPVEVMEWVPGHAYIEIGGQEYELVPQPYTLESDVESKVVYVDINSVDKMCQRHIEDSIVLTNTPADVDDIHTAQMHLAECGALGVIFIDDLDCRRRIVCTGNWSPIEIQGLPPKIPVLQVPMSRGLEILRRATSRARIVTEKCFTRNSVGYIVEALLPGKYEDSRNCITITAHHDHWFTGASDNLVGIAIIFTLAKVLRNYSPKYGIKFISFTAEESGAPNYCPWYWIYGSRTYVRKYSHNILLNINFDVIMRGKVSVYSSPDVGSLLKDLATALDLDTKLELDQPIFDSYSFFMHGIPSTTLSTFTEVLESRIYHSDLDRMDNIDPHIVPKLVVLTKKFVEELERMDLREILRPSLLIEYIINSLRASYVPLELINELYRMYRSTKLRSETVGIDKYLELYQKTLRLISMMVKPIMWQGYRHLGSREEIAVMPWYRAAELDTWYEIVFESLVEPPAAKAKEFIKERTRKIIELVRSFLADIESI